MRAHRILVPLLGAAAVGCTQLQPFAAVPAPKPKGAVEAGTRVAICYNPMWDSTAKVREAAQAECDANATPSKIDTDYLLDLCPTLMPAHATFVCAPKS